jgi:lysophospholipase L1-like esterase
MKSIPLLIVAALISGADLVADNVDPADSRIVYTGRWEFSNPSEPWCTWQGSSIKARFRGTAIEAEFDGASKPEYIRIIVDDNAAKSKKLELSTNRQTYTLATGLNSGEHQIEIIKESYAGKGRMTFHGFKVTGDGLVKIAKTKQPLRIVFYGDSNLAGSSLEHEKNKGDPSLRGSYYSFAGIASRMLDAEYHNISVGGAKIATGLNSGMSFYNRMDFYEPEPRWKPESFPADLCVVNLGANDISAKSKEEIKKDYKSFVSTIRTFHPKARIVLMNGYGWSREEPANYTNEVIAEMDDAELSRVIFPWLFNEWHGCEYDHAGMAQTLVDYLVQIDPKYKQVRPMDVMDGFGRNGNVANGSFEFDAPFGGYGWRYFTDGAERIHDPNSSAEGARFLRLPEGKQVHQPNPATKDKTYTIKLKMRGQADGDQGRIRIEFRDQEWRHEIPNSSKTFTHKLDTSWKEYIVTVKSPPGVQPPDSSRDTWQIIIRLESHSGTVDFDDVRLSSAKQPTP